MLSSVGCFALHPSLHPQLGLDREKMLEGAQLVLDYIVIPSCPLWVPIMGASRNTWTQFRNPWGRHWPKEVTWLFSEWRVAVGPLSHDWNLLQGCRCDKNNDVDPILTRVLHIEDRQLYTFYRTGQGTFT